jgi:hypothetical protein
MRTREVILAAEKLRLAEAAQRVKEAKKLQEAEAATCRRSWQRAQEEKRAQAALAAEQQQLADETAQRRAEEVKGS